MSCTAFLANLCNNLSCILYTNFVICFALLFLSNLCNNLSKHYIGNFLYILCHFFSAILNHIFVLYIYIENILYIILDKM